MEISLWMLSLRWLGSGSSMASAVPTAQARPGLLLAAAITLGNGELSFSEANQAALQFLYSEL